MALIQSFNSKFVVIQSNLRLLIEFSCNLKTSYLNPQCRSNNFDVGGKRSKGMSVILKVVFMASMQHCIQGNIIGVKYFTEQKIKRLCQRCQRCTVHCIQWPLTPARREGYLLFEKPSILWV